MQILQLTFDNPKKTWEILCTLLPSKSNSTAPNSIIVNNSCLNDPTDVVEEFNNHFASIGKSLATSISDDNNTLIISKSMLIFHIFTIDISIRGDKFNYFLKIK